MKKIILASIAMLFIIAAQSQPLHSIRFIYFGEELKPIGTKIIGVEKVFPLNDKVLDSIFGRSIKTDINTFTIVSNLIKNKKYQTPHPSKEEIYGGGLEVVDSDGFAFSLFWPKQKDFFNDLHTSLIEKNSDKVVIELFKDYY